MGGNQHMQQMKAKKPLPRLFEYAGRFKYFTYASIALSGLSAIIALLPFVFIWLIVRDALAAMPDFGSATQLPLYGWLAVASAIASILVYVAALMCSHIAAFRIARNIRIRAMRHIVALPLGVLDSMGSGKVRSIVNDSSAATEAFLAHQTPDKAGALVTPVGILVMLLVFDWRLGLASLVPVAIAFALLARMIGGKMEKSMKQYKDALEDMNNEAVEYVRGVPVVKTFGQTVHSFSRFRESIERYNKWTTDYTLKLRPSMMGFSLGINAVFAFLIAAALLVTQGSPADPSFLAGLLFYIVFTPIVTVTLNKIMYSSENHMIVNDAMDRIDSLLALKPLAEAKSVAKPKGSAICVRNATFSYGRSDRRAIDGVSLEVGEGKTLALVGPSGGGKTTLASLVARFWDVDEGSITIGGVDVRDIDSATLMNTVSYVFQNSRLLKASILENVRMGRPSATRREVIQALSLAQCDDIIAKLPGGIDAVYGSKGIYLSGGECQRVAIARAILKGAPVLVLDEATAFADPENEQLVQKAFASLSKDRTVIMIAHRLSTIVGADEICVLASGKIAERGRHRELVDRGGLYGAMWKEYQSAVAWKVGGAA
jgi:ATP-binding cassette, subfamily B, bacterial IrtA/YbtP